MKKLIYDNKIQAPERVYALDSLRAIMMLLGLVLHASITYGSMDYAGVWALKDQNNSPVFDMITALIHSFRMPVFFVASGFFGAMLLYKRGARGMILNRVKRILLPFVVSVLLIFPLVVVGFGYSEAAFAGSETPFKKAISPIIAGRFLQYRTAHLWFLYYLILFSFLAWLIAKLFYKTTALNRSVDERFKSILKNFWISSACITAFLFVCFKVMHTYYLVTSTGWGINPGAFIAYFGFYAAGWMVYRTNSLELLKRYPLSQLGVGLLLFFVFAVIPWSGGRWAVNMRQALAAVYSVFLIFGVIAFFLSRFNFYSKWMAYIMDASYWVYIIHLPIITFVPGLMAGISMPSIIKFSITVMTTLVICFGTYKYFVRNSFIGVFLNGKKHRQRKEADGEKDVAIRA